MDRWIGQIFFGEFQQRRSKTKDIGPNRKYINYEHVWTTFDPGTCPLKMAIFGLKTLFF
jgi:hypothetical protein